MAQAEALARLANLVRFDFGANGTEASRVAARNVFEVRVEGYLLREHQLVPSQPRAICYTLNKRHRGRRASNPNVANVQQLVSRPVIRCDNVCRLSRAFANRWRRECVQLHDRVSTELKIQIECEQIETSSNNRTPHQHLPQTSGNHIGVQCALPVACAATASGAQKDLVKLAAPPPV